MEFLRKIRAKIGGYFWLPCPLCGEFFGGFEIGNGHITDEKGVMSCCCKNCDFEAGVIEALNGNVLSVSLKARELIKT